MPTYWISSIPKNNIFGGKYVFEFSDDYESVSVDFVNRVVETAFYMNLLLKDISEYESAKAIIEKNLTKFWNE